MLPCALVKYGAVLLRNKKSQMTHTRPAPFCLLKICTFLIVGKYSLVFLHKRKAPHILVFSVLDYINLTNGG